MIIEKDGRNMLLRSGVSSAADDVALGREQGCGLQHIGYESLMRIYWKARAP
jgi:hypothetical protein